MYGANVDAQPYKHHAIQVIFPNKGSLCKIDIQYFKSLFIIDSNIPHQVQMSEG